MSLQLVTNIPTNGTIVIKFPNSININACNINSTTILCQINNINTVALTFNNIFTTKAINFTLNAINPVYSQNLTITACSFDTLSNYLDCGSLPFFSVLSTILPSSLVNVSFSSNYVYDVSSYIMILNLTNYTIVSGTGIITFPSLLTFMNATTFNCLVNTNPYCSLNATSPIKITFPINASVSYYNIIVTNIRNPSSTISFQFNFTITDNSSNIYYNIISSYYQMLYPYLLTNSSYTTTNCTNTAIGNYSISFNLPFNILSGLVTVFYQNNLIYTLNYSNPLVLINYTTTSTLQPYNLFLNISTQDSLYLIFNSTITITNCLPFYINVAGTISGAPYDSSSILITFTTIGNLILVTLPT
jgi:hypothetical protein